MKRTVFFTFLFSCSLFILHGQGDNSYWRGSYFAGEPLQIGNRVQFLFDDYIVEDKYGLKRVVGPVEKYSGNPLCFGDGYEVSLRRIIYDPREKVYKGWYNHLRRRQGWHYETLYAESKDGIKWEKPELDFYLRDGQKTNIVIQKDNSTAELVEVILDTLATYPSRRYMAYVKIHLSGEGRSVVRMFSADGKKWSFAPDPVVIRGTHDGSWSFVNDLGVTP